MKKTKVKIITITVSLLALIVLLILSTLIVNYFAGKNNAFSQAINRILPFPAASVGFGNFITIRLVENNLKAVKNFYESQDFSEQGLRIDFSTENGKKRLLIKEKDVLNKLIENEIVKKIAEEKGVKVTDEMVSQEVNRKINEGGDEKKARENLMKLYGWTLDKFKERIVLPEMYKERLAEKIYENIDLNSAQIKIKEADSKIKSGESFDEVAKEFSEGESAKTGGDLGWFSAEQMLPEISEKVFQMEKGQTSSIIQSQLGFHIVRLDDKKEENGTQMVKIKQIFTRIPNFADWLIDESQDIKVKIFIAGYSWDKENMRLEFKDENLKKFEENLIENSQGDISVF